MVAIALKEARKHKAHGGVVRSGRAAAEAVLPEDHKLGMRVPKGGSMCANCHFLASPTTCGNEGFIKWNDGATLPDPSDEYCCDLYFPREKPRRARGGKVMVGPIRGDAPGRTDVHEGSVPDGSYILSADIVSHLGANNTDAGLKLAHHLFGPNGIFARKEEDRSNRVHGETSSTGKPVDCVLAGGEYSIAPSTVRKIGHGDIDLGHKILDRWSMLVRKDHVETLRGLPPPARD